MLFFVQVSSEVGEVKCKQLWRNPLAFYCPLVAGCGPVPVQDWSSITTNKNHMSLSGKKYSVDFFQTTKAVMINLLPPHKQKVLEQKNREGRESKVQTMCWQKDKEGHNRAKSSVKYILWQARYVTFKSSALLETDGAKQVGNRKSCQRCRWRAVEGESCRGMKLRDDGTVTERKGAGG